MVRSASQTHACVLVTTGLPVSFSMRSMTETVRHLLHGMYAPSTSGCSRNIASGQIIPSLRRKRPDYIGIWAAQTAECYNLNPVMSQEPNQALVLVFGKRTRHHHPV